MLKHWKRTLALLGVAAAVALVSAGLALGVKPPKPPPEPPPSGPGLIAFNDAGEGVAVMNPDGTGRTPVALFNDDLSLAMPAWSHMFSDGTVKLFWSETDGVLMVVDVSPEIGVPIAVPGVDVIGGSSPFDVAPSVPREDGTETVRICRPDKEINPETGEGRGKIKVFQLIYDPQCGDFTVDADTAPVFIVAPWGTGYGSPEFSPDGTWIAFHATIPELDHETSIWLAKSDASEPPVLVTDAPGCRDRSPVWSPDGSQLAFLSNRDAKNRWAGDEIYIASLNPDMSVASIERKTDRKTGGVEMSWSPVDGEQICYMISGGEAAIKDYSVAKLMLTTGEQHELGKGCYPDWSPMDLPPLPWAE